MVFSVLCVLYISFTVFSPHTSRYEDLQLHYPILLSTLCVVCDKCAYHILPPILLCVNLIPHSTLCVRCSTLCVRALCVFVSHKSTQAQCTPGHGRVHCSLLAPGSALGRTLASGRGLRREVPALPLGVGDARSLDRPSGPPRLDQPLLDALRYALLLDAARRAARRIAAGAGAQCGQRALEELRVQHAVPLGCQVDARPHPVGLVHELGRRVLAPDRRADSCTRDAAGHLERAEQVQRVIVRVAGELAREALVDEAALQVLRLVRVPCMCGEM